MLKKSLLLLLFAGAINSAFGMGYLFEQLGERQDLYSRQEQSVMTPEKEYYLNFKDTLKRKLDAMPKNISLVRDINDKEKLEQLKKVVGLDFAKEYEAANKHDLTSKAYRSIKSKFIADGFSTDEQNKRRDDIQKRHGLLLNIIYNELLNQNEQPKARL